MSLMNRLSIARKLMLLTLLVLMAISIPSFFQIRQTHELASAAEGELNGLAPARQLIKLAQLTQHHRGLSAGWLGGNTQVQAAREAKNGEVRQQVAKLDALLTQHGMSSDMRKAWDEARSRWEALSTEVGNQALKAAESSSRHAQVIATQFRLLDLLVDQSGLILDPEADTYFLITASLLKLPMATEALGQTRARGAGFLAEKKIGPEGRTLLASLVQQATDQHSGMVAAFGKSFAVNAALKRELGGALAALAGQVEGSMQLARQELITKEELTLAAPEYIGNFTRTIDAMFAFEDSALAALDQLLQARVQNLRFTGRLVMGLLVLMMLGIFWVARGISKGITAPLQRASLLAQQIADRDLCGDISEQRRDEIGELNTALLSMRDGLRSVIGEVRGNAEHVSMASDELSQGSNDLSQRTEQQASALEQTASSMEELTGTVRSNAGEAAEANSLARHTSEVAVAAGDSVQKLVQTMGQIESSSRKIEEIIAVIDGIAFQTNILALNAAVEAARAGEQGRGFAVVASEVRALAQRSAEAAKQIKQLIATSVEQVGSGARLVGGAGDTMQEVVAAIGRLTDMVARISQASSEQSGGLVQINEAVSHMDELTQQNAALVEETAAAGMNLRERAQQLAALVGTFKVPSTRH